MTPLDKLTALVEQGPKAYHRDYKRTVDYAELCKTLVSGDGMDVLMKQFVKREDDVAYKNRTTHTQHITMSITKTVRDPEKKALRANNIQNVIANEDKNKLKEFLDYVSMFYSKKDVQNYIDTVLLDVMDTDPNSFLLIDFDDFDHLTEKASPYPVIIRAKDAVDYEYENGVLQYLIQKDTETKRIGGVEKEVTEYYYHGPMVSFKLEPMGDDDVEGDYAIVEIGDNKYMFSQYDHGVKVVPAIRLGFVPDLSTDGRTMVVFWDAAIAYLKKTIKVNSEMDLTASLIAFPKEIRYVSKCTNTGCFNGKLADSNQVCPSCKGTGNEQLPTSAQDTITLKLPNNPQDIVSLDSLYRTVSPDVAIINWQEDYLDKLSMKCLTSVYSGETYSRENIANTATGENINLQAVYDSLYPLALKVSEIYEFVHYCVAEILDLDEGLTVKKVFSKDFKMRSKEELINDRKAAVESGADPHVISAIDDDIARLIYVDDPSEFNRYMVMKSHYPFSGLSEEEKRDVIASGNARKRDIVLAANYGQVFDMVNEMVAEGKNVDFWETSRKKQREVIDSVVDNIIAEIEGGSPATGRFEVGMQISDSDKEAQSSLRGTVGGVQGIIEIITNVAAGVINEEAAVAMLMTLYGFDEETAQKMAKTQANIADIEAVAKAKV